jgi:subtilisin-like proprotein convertase family protein
MHPAVVSIAPSPAEMISRTRLVLLLAAATAAQASAATQSFASSAGIVFSDGTPAAGNPYPSTVNVEGLPGVVSKITVKLTGFSHTFPGDVDLMLVAPDGTHAIILSDVGGGDDVSGLTITLDDDAAASPPLATPLTTGTYKPTNSVTGDIFPKPAPDTSDRVALSTFNGLAPTGRWSLYALDDGSADGGSIQSWTLEMTTVPAALPGDLVISEFRVCGSSGANDEFIEIQNVSGSDHTVQTLDGSPGYAVTASDGTTRFVIPNGTFIPDGGHFLGVNSVGYSLGSYPAGQSTATGNAFYTADIPDNSGIALFRTANPALFNITHRLDAVGSNVEANGLYREGNGLPFIVPSSIDSSFVRDFHGGKVKDTGDNASDFLFVDTNGSSIGAGQRLGSPGPENLASPVRLPAGPPLVRRSVDPDAPLSSSPNRLRDFISDPATSSYFGTYCVTRKFTNHTGRSITRLRFRVVDIATFPAPAGVADLRARTCGAINLPMSNGHFATIVGTTLEQPPSQPNGGAFNATLGVPAVSPSTPLLDGASVNVRFLFGIQQTGDIRLAIIPETLPAAAAGEWVVRGNTEIPALEMEASASAAITSVTRLTTDVKVEHSCPTGGLYQLQRSINLSSWTDLGPVLPGSGLPATYFHSAGADPDKQFYRLKELR